VIPRAREKEITMKETKTMGSETTGNEKAAKAKTGKPGKAQTGKAKTGKAMPGKAKFGKHKFGKAQPGDEKSYALEPHQIVLRPLVTEKGVHRSSRFNAYAFEVSTQANKTEIKDAVETLFDVKVVKVHTQNRKGKPRRTRFNHGYTIDWKKAIVTLDSEDHINFF
jgi:large subunit ribosomal protein L23